MKITNKLIITRRLFFSLQNSKNSFNKSAFTLVELVILITILTIIWVIAYIAFTWYQSDARDSKRLADLDNISKWITLWFVDWVGIMSYIVWSWANIRYDWWGALSIYWFTGSANLSSHYQAWDLNYTTLWFKQSDFQDPLKNIPYKMWATTFGNQYEVAATIENWGTNTTLVVWNWSNRKSNTASWARDYIDNDKFYLSWVTSNMTSLHIWDKVMIASWSYVISMMKSNYIQVDRTIDTPWENIVLNNNESLHLIRWYISSWTTIKTLTENTPYDPKYVPYKLN